MIVSQIVLNVKNFLADKGVYRSDQFILDCINEGYRVTSVLALFHERKMSVNVQGTRNMVCLPKDADGEMIAPVYVSDASPVSATNVNAGNRLYPASLDKFELHTQIWEGSGSTSGTDRDVKYYCPLSTHHNAWAELWITPAEKNPQLNFIGPCVPKALGLTDSPKLEERFVDLLFYYAIFMGFVSEPGKGEDAVRGFKLYVQVLNNLTDAIRFRFPSNQWFKPKALEFHFDGPRADNMWAQQVAKKKGKQAEEE